MRKLAAGSDERWLVLMLLKEIKIIAAKIEEKKEEEFWVTERNRKKTDLNMLDKKTQTFAGKSKK